MEKTTRIVLLVTNSFILTFHYFLKLSSKGLGRIALISFSLGTILAIHAVLMILAMAEQMGLSSSSFLSNISETRILLFIQWILFVIVLCTFHLLEFFVTAIHNPTVVDASSFVVNHSKSYTTAMLVSNMNTKMFFVQTFLINQP